MTALNKIISEKRQLNAFYKKGIYTIEDLVTLKPQKYIDLSHFSDLNSIQSNDKVLVKIEIIGAEAKMTKSGIYSTLVEAKDLIYGKSIVIYYFSQPYKVNQFRKGDIYAIYASVMSPGYREVVLSNPIKEYRGDIDLDKLGIVPIYRKIKGLSDETFKHCLDQAIEYMESKKDYLPLDITYDYGMVSFTEGISLLHEPKDKNDLKNAMNRRIIDDVLYYSYMLYKNDNQISKVDYSFKQNECLVTEYEKRLSFKLTNDQKNTINILHKKGLSGDRINTLICGDVGCGKTEVAKFLSLYAVGAKKQVVVLTPTTVLARQHFKDFSRSFEGMGINVALMVSTLKTKEKRDLINGIKDQSIDIIISTHSILSDSIIIPNLGLVIIDEEHRFGVNHREKLSNKYPYSHRISMTATPIPRSLALTMYGSSVELINIKEKPQNRLPIKTILGDKKIINESIKEALDKGFQAYIVAPSIDNDNEMVSVENVAEEFKTDFPNVKFEILTGCTNSKDQEKIFQKFNENEVKVLISTTIIEVGINNPNASLIVIRDAERFGLAQLHQLRGRVGRSEAVAPYSKCILQSETCTEKALQRLNIMTNCNDGFELAEHDVQLRGVGQLTGDVQSGQNRFVEIMLKYPQTIDIANSIINKMVNRGGRELEKMEEHFSEYYDEETDA